VEKWRGFSNKFYAIMNVYGKEIIIRLLDEGKVSKKSIKS